MIFGSRRWCVGLFALGLLCISPGQANGPPLELKKVKYAQLAEIIEANRGKVILVDLWQTT